MSEINKWWPSTEQGAQQPDLQLHASEDADAAALPPPDATPDVIDNLSNEARVLKQARKLPMTKLSEEQISAVRRDFCNYTNAHALADSAAAKQIGISASSLSQWRTNQYKGDNEKIARLVNDWMERHARQRQLALPSDFIMTTVAQEMQAIVTTACASTSMAAIVAPSGCGKTMLLEIFAEKFRGTYLYCTEDLTPAQFLRQMSKALGLSTGRGRQTRHDMLTDIAEKLRGTNRPIFLDEAHRLPRDVLPRLRSLHDMAQVPIIMAGTRTILDHVNDRANGCGQFASRTLQYNAIDYVHNAEDPDGNGQKVGRPLFTREEIQQFLGNMQVKFEPDAFALGWAVACLVNHGCLRTLRRLVMLVRPNVLTREKPITRRELHQALTQLYGTQGSIITRAAGAHLERCKVA